MILLRYRISYSQPTNIGEATENPIFGNHRWVGSLYYGNLPTEGIANPVFCSLLWANVSISNYVQIYSRELCKSAI